MFNLNGNNYDSNQLSEGGKQILSLLNEAQNELKHLETQKSLLQVAQKELINRLKPMLPDPVSPTTHGSAEILGEASDEIPTASEVEPKN